MSISHHCVTCFYTLPEPRVGGGLTEADTKMSS